MKENVVAKSLQTLGVCIFVIGILGAFACGGVFPAVTLTSRGGIDSSYNWGLVAAVIASSIISGSVFVALAEIIRLLQSCVDKLDKIAGGGFSSSSDNRHDIVKDIESNLPEI